VSRLKLAPESARLMDFNPVAKWIVYKKAFPRCWTTIFGCYASILKFCAEATNIGALEAEVTIGICAGPRFFDRNMQIQSIGIEPDAATMANRLRLGNFRQAQQTSVKRAGFILAPLRHGYVDVREPQGAGDTGYLDCSDY
jgi:hypothetical protein